MQLNYDYFTSCDKVSKSMVQTNPRYKNFSQMYYTVGDTEQFWEALNISESSNAEKGIKGIKGIKDPQISTQNIFKNIDTFIPFEGYKNISRAQVEDTFNYIFHKFKKGIFIKIKDGQLQSFIPFSKATFINEWSGLIKIDPKFQNMENFFKVHNDLSNKLNNTNYKFNPNRVNFDPSYWYANNCILRYENPINEGETNYAQLKSMFLELCAERDLPDIEFFVNRRDFPILTRNGTEPYDNIYGENVPLKSYKFDKYTPILSMCSSDRFADVAIPTHEDWARIKSDEGIYFPLKCRNYTFKFNHKWDTKKNVAIFRGSNTGCGYNDQNNTRLKLARLGRLHPDLLDVGITNWNLRIRKNKDSKYLQIPDVGNLNLVGKLSPEEQSNYKFLINVDGHVSAFRLSLELSMGSCVLLIESVEKWKMWFFDLLEPYVNYVPIKSDLSDLMDQINWCIKNDSKCKTIAQNALKFYQKFLTKKGVLDNLQKTLFRLAQDMGDYKVKIDPLIFQTSMEHDTLIQEQQNTFKKSTGLFPKNVGRNYGSLKGLEKFVESALRPDREITLVGVEVKPIFKSKTTRVILYQIGAEYVVGKRTYTPIKKIEFVHEAFVGLKVINNLLKFCPNFMYTLGYRDETNVTYLPPEYHDLGFDKTKDYKEVTVLQEYIKGPTLQEFLKTCTLKSYLEIVLQVSCSLVIAQTLYGFVHHDLKPWNVIISILSEPVMIEYFLRVDNGQEIVYKIKTKYIPIIVDYGKSHVVYNNVHYGIIDPFKINKNIDLITMLVSTINELILRKANVENVDPQDLLYIVNFLSKEKVKNIFELKNFISKNKKFGNTLVEDIKLESGKSKTVFEEFFKYLTPLTRKYKIAFGRSDLTLNVWSSNPRQIADVAFGIELEDRINSYLEVPRRIYKNPMPQASNRFTTIMIAQKMFDGLIIPKMEFKKFATQNKLTEKQVKSVLTEYNKIEKFILEFYITQLNKKTREPFNVLGGSKEPQKKDVLNFGIKPSRSLFLDSNVSVDDLTTQMKNLPAQFPDYSYYATLVMEVLRNRGPFKMLEEDRKFYMDNFTILFDENYTNKVVDIETIRFYENL